MAYRNRIQQTITSVSATGGTGLGPVTLGTAVSGPWLALEAADDGASFDATFVQGDDAEVATGCTYTHSGTELSRGTFEKSTTGSPLVLTSSAVVFLSPSAATLARWEQVTHAQSIQSTTSADPTISVNRWHYLDLSGLTANRTATLPATSAVGDWVGLHITTGDDAYELLVTAGAGDTLNAVAGGTEWSRLFITGERLLLRCVVANTTWVVEEDGRIPCVASMYLAADEGSKLASTWNKTGVDTALVNIGGIADTANERILIRRAGRYQVVGILSLSLSVNGSVYTTIYVNETNRQYLVRGQTVGATSVAVVHGSAVLEVVAGDRVELYSIHTPDTQTHQGGNVVDATRLYAKEIL